MVPKMVHRNAEGPIIRYALATPRSGWELGDETMPESVLHDEAVTLLRALLAAWADRHGDALVARNLAIRWDEERPQFGVDPDLAVLVPRPHEAADLRSVCTWKPGQAPPALAIEVVSETNPRKDYALAPDKYAASGIGELWIFDPLLAGPTSHGGPLRLQLWRRDADGTFGRVYAGDGPAWSSAVEAWLVPVDEGRRLRIARDADATDFWMTGEEAERAAKEAERAAKEAALARIAELEAQLGAAKTR